MDTTRKQEEIADLNDLTSDIRAYQEEQEAGTAQLPTAQVVLRVARSYIERGWCQGALARNQDGVPVAAAQETAVTWCASGAFSRATTNLDADPSADGKAWALLELALPEEWPDLAVYNDDDRTTQTDIIDLYTRAITRAEHIAARKAGA